MSRFGLKMLALSVVSLFVTAALSIVVTCVLFSNYNDTIMVDRARVGVSVLKQELIYEEDGLAELYSHWYDSGDLALSVTEKNTALIEEDWKKFSSSDHEFCQITDNTGAVVWKSANFKISSFDVSTVLTGSEKVGILSDTNVPLFYVYSVPVKGDSGVVGTCTIGFDLEATDWLENVKAQTHAEVTIFQGKTRYSTTVINTDGTRAVGTDMADNVAKVVVDGLSEYTGRATVVGNPFFVCYEPMFDMNGKYVGAYFAGTNTTEADSLFTSTIIFASLSALAVMIAMCVVTYLFNNKTVIKPITVVSDLADSMSRGELNVPDFTYNFGNDEVGDFARKLQDTKHTLNSYISDMSGILESMAGGDFTKTPGVEYHGDFVAIKNAFTRIHEVLGDMLNNMNVSSDEVLTGSRQMAEGSQSLAEGTTRQAAAIEELSSTITEINDQVSKNADNAAKAKDYSGEVESKIIRQNHEVNEMVSAMKEIEEKSKQIENIIKTIDDIAFQTNILALNAAVEAARAGDAGKGFAVVADEVRNLASKSAEAASSTTELITASIDAVDKGSKIAVTTAETMKEVMDISRQTTELIVGIADASAHQADSIQQVMTGIDQISQVVQMNSATAEETAASCQELNGQSNVLKEQVSRFVI